jgi:mycofactocin precursor
MFRETHNAIATPVADAVTPQAEARTPAASPELAVLKEGQPDIGKPRIVEEIVIEEVSIDGMCGVY